jgi:hypothetical protein
MLDPKSEEKMKEILRKEMEALTPGDIEFLKARITYLSPADRERYQAVLAPVEENPKPKKSK